MQTEAGLDTGPVRLVKKLPIEETDNALTLFEKLSKLGSEAMTEALGLLQRGELPSIPQDDSKATHAPQLEKDDGRIRWGESAKQISHRFRGVTAYPGSWTTVKGETLKVHSIAIQNTKGQPGKIIAVSKEGVLVGAGEGSILFKTVQPASKPKMSAHDWANGYRVNVGDTFE